MVRLQRIFINAHDNGQIFPFGRSGNNDSGGPGVDMGSSLFSLGKESRRFQYNFDFEIAPGQIGWIALGQNEDRFSIDDQSVTINLDFSSEATVC